MIVGSNTGYDVEQPFVGDQFEIFELLNQAKVDLFSRSIKMGRDLIDYLLINREHFFIDYLIRNGKFSNAIFMHSNSNNNNKLILNPNYDRKDANEHNFECYYTTGGTNSVTSNIRHVLKIFPNCCLYVPENGIKI